MTINNLLAYCLQIGLLVGLASFLPALLRLRAPVAKLAFWQLLLAASLLLPLVQPWRQETISFRRAQVSTTSVAVRPALARRAAHLSTTEIALAILCAGAVARFGWLAAGFWRLRRYRRQSRPLEPAPDWSVEADIRISDEIGSPVTFGFLRPVVLLPAGFAALGAALRDAILCHEVLHVRRRDWLFTIAEELVRAVFWFHPAVWWVLGEIQLAREQYVDRLVIEMTKSRDQYLDALLAMAGALSGAGVQLDLAPAPLFLRKRHLKQRVISILKEVRMSKARTISTLMASLAGLAAACWLVTGTFPLSASPQIVTDPNGVTVDLSGAHLLHRGAVPYPPDAIAAGVQGIVQVQVKIDGNGNVSDASILSGPDQLRKSVLQSVLTWHFTKDSANSTRQVNISFQPPPGLQAAVQKFIGADAQKRPPTPGNEQTATRISSIDIIGLPDASREELMGKLNVHVGDQANADNIRELSRVARQFDEHLNVSVRRFPAGESAITISAPGIMRTPAPLGGVTGGVLSSSAEPQIAKTAVISIDGITQQAKLISQPQPVYPALAKQARVQGNVAFNAVIGADGHVRDLQVVKGQPLLVQAAMDAVRDWVYQPTLLNGQPVAVSTTIEVNFTLQN